MKRTLMIEINEHLTIPFEEIELSFSRSSGPGGQNVNKLATKVLLRFDVGTSNALSDEQKAIIRRRLATRIGRDGSLRVIAGSERSQKANREAAFERFARLIRDALRPRKKRKQTRPTAASRERRLTEKKRQSERKKHRGYRSRGDE